MIAKHIINLFFLSTFAIASAHAEDYKNPFGVVLGKVNSELKVSDYKETAGIDFHADMTPEQASEYFSSFSVRVSKISHTVISVSGVFSDDVTYEQCKVYFNILRTKYPELKVHERAEVLQSAPYTVYTSCFDISKFGNIPKEQLSGLNSVTFAIDDESILQLLLDEQGEWEEKNYFYGKPEGE